MSSRVYEIVAPDNGRDYFDDFDIGSFCPMCKTQLRPVTEDRRWRTVRRYDWSYTYDGKLIVTSRVKVFLEEQGIVGLIYKPIGRGGENFLLQSSSILPIDIENMKIALLKKCALCGNYAEVILKSNVILRDCSAQNDMTIFRTDVEFGSYTAKFPLLVIFERLKVILASRFPELGFKPAACPG